MELELTNSTEKTLVDQEIFDLLEDKKIYLNSRGYAIFNENGKTVMLHRYVFKHFNPDVNIDKLEVDHINQNKLDNQINNLRIATDSLNKLNKSKYSNNKCGIKNVCYSNSHKKWKLDITLNDRKYQKVIYNTREEALFALKYLIENVANEQEKEFLCIDDANFDDISDIRKEIIKADLDNYIVKTNKKKYKILTIKNEKTYIYKARNKYAIQITIFNKQYCFGSYDTFDSAKLYRDFLIELFNNTDSENINDMIDRAKITFENNEIIMHKIIYLLNKKIDNI